MPDGQFGHVRWSIDVDESELEEDGPWTLTTVWVSSAGDPHEEVRDIYGPFDDISHLEDVVESEAKDMIDYERLS